MVIWPAFRMGSIESTTILSTHLSLIESVHYRLKNGSISIRAVQLIRIGCRVGWSNRGILRSANRMIETSMIQDSTKQTVRTIISSKRDSSIDNTMGLVLWKIFSMKNRGNGKSSVPFFSPMLHQNVISSVWKIRTYVCNKIILSSKKILYFYQKWFDRGLISFQRWFPQPRVST